MDRQQRPYNTVLSTLDTYFPVVTTLREYLETVLDDDAHCLDASDRTVYEKLLDTAYVASSVPLEDTKRFTPFSPVSHMQDVIDRAQGRLFLKSRGGRPSNIITSGYRRVNQQDARSKFGATRVPLTNYFVNTMITALQGPDWEALLQRIGEDAIFHLLTETSMFLSLPNGCLCQLTGDPILHVKRTPGSHQGQGSLSSSSSSSHGVKRRCVIGYNEDRPAKRPKLAHASDGTKSRQVPVPDPEKVTSSNVAFLRARIFYSRPSVIPHTTKIIVGLPPKHVLNRFYPAWQSNKGREKGTPVDVDMRAQMEHARHLAKYIFPRPYTLANAFTGSTQRYAVPRMPDYTDREQEIKKLGSCKTPKRLKHVLCILEKMIWSHHKCKYKMLLDMACPSKLSREGDANSPLDSSAILEMMSETSVQLQTQPSIANTSVSLDSAGRPIFTHDPSEAKRHARYKPRFAEFACGVEEVYRYAVLVTKTVIPQAFWGSNDNFELAMQHVKHMIVARRYETTTVHRILQGFQTSSCDWLMPHTEGAQKQSRVSVTDTLKRRELLEDFIFWYFDSFLIPLLKCTFYITESSAFRNRVLYFRHDDWRTLCVPLVEKLSTDTFQRIDQHEAQEILRQRRLGFSFVRLLPKETGVRPIVNLRRRVDKNAYGQAQSINQILQAAFQILTYEKDRQLERLGASVFGPNEIYTKLKAFKTRLTDGKPSARLPNLYFVKVDVQACFDTIEQTKLLGILRDLLTEDTYMIQRYGTVNKAGEKIQRKYVKNALPEDDHPHFLAYAAQLANALRNTIFVDQVVYPYSRTQEIISLLEEHITENIVKIGNEYYRQIVGIPQGSVLSAILCSFFYGDLERTKFRFTEDPDCVLMRLIDDWLFVTTSRTKAAHFYDVVSAGHPEYGCFISKDKTLMNFDHPSLANILDPRSKVFPWCGYSINLTDLSVTVDYSRYHPTYLQDSLTVDFGCRPGAAFSYKMMQLAKSKSHIIYNDAELNSSHAIYLNVYQNYTVLAMKMHHYLRQWGLDLTKGHDFIMRTIRQTIRFSYTSVCTKAGHKLAQQHHARIIIRQPQTTWLGLHAFHTVLSRKPQAYARILRSLRFELGLSKNRHFKKQFREVIAEGLSTLTLLSF